LLESGWLRRYGVKASTDIPAIIDYPGLPPRTFVREAVSGTIIGKVLAKSQLGKAAYNLNCPFDPGRIPVISSLPHFYARFGLDG